MSRPQNIGIKALEIYIPSEYVNQEDLEKFDGIPQGKYTIGLGQTNMAFVNDREDIYSLCLTSFSKLIKNYNIDVNKIGRLEVGTETLLDKSKSVKSVLMQLMEGNNDVEGIDTINACYGGTAAVINAVNWIESSSWDGRDAAVVCGDIAIYSKGAARPTGGAGSVALLIGPDAPIVFESSRGSYMEHAYDFYKPDFTSEYPVVDGHFSLSCYVKALDNCYKNYSKKVTKDASKTVGVNHFNYNAFHVPTCKLVTKSFARLLYNDYKSDPSKFNFDEETAKLVDVDYETSLVDRNLEKVFLGLTKETKKTQLDPALKVPTNTGNMYTASAWASLCSLLYYVGSEKLQDKRIGIFSYGSGLASTLLSAKVVGDISHITKNLDIDYKLGEGRTKRSPEQYVTAIDLREKIHLQKSIAPTGSIETLAKGTYYLAEIDDKFRRSYKKVE
ncbi:3-hydroxy-3-methylglutaryl coenzyme A synthase [Yamadazyma tenuis]|uniref:Hydroxymethylglutaryl-CoA synthase n=1 Tax=Candida tenuis (strain ATCC 10573 / BCRC 21748 / CBS 615 / JCM 9827 / NBRC 10315 / NRRL Y-1498 / VKM Y-70) TaxID=590646 RepID=G3AYW1_CANTC|nr:hydroxymethylglutaryl-CoA synthase [Yamadazyma tenuis ATCC 10573]EGV65944.1 hydroxymethylglutaryl-CoA synthase [Yamadazyma tenuis ATCC 10573]WEJ95724.1 3-hydroxy-3-methylglutaryl coenzyme A synthase [Yamadazyma tenuis]